MFDDIFTPFDQREILVPEMGEPSSSTTIPVTEGAANTVPDGPIAAKRIALSNKKRASQAVSRLLDFAEL